MRYLLGFCLIFIFFVWKIFSIGPLPSEDMTGEEKRTLYLSYVFAFAAVAIPVGIAI